MAISGATKVYGVIGRPVRHSLSPDLHNHWFAEHDIDALYAAFDAAPESGADIATAIRTLGLAGANVTVPHKAALLPHLDVVDDLGRIVGAVNTISNHDGRLIGTNTDVEGFCRGLEEAFGAVLAEANVVVLGVGGAGRAIAAGAALRGAREVFLLNRTAGTAEQWATHLGESFKQTKFTPMPLDDTGFRFAARKSTVFVNATSGDAAALVSRFDADQVPKGAVWCDINYWMDRPPLFSQCASRGVRVLDGLPMLVHQAALAFQVWTGRSVDTRPALARASAVGR